MVKCFYAHINYEGEIQFDKNSLVASFRNVEWAIKFMRGCPISYYWVLIEGKSNSNLERDNADTKFIQAYHSGNPVAHYWHNGIMRLVYREEVNV